MIAESAESAEKSQKGAERGFSRSRPLDSTLGGIGQLRIFQNSTGAVERSRPRRSWQAVPRRVGPCIYQYGIKCRFYAVSASNLLVSVLFGMIHCRGSANVYDSRLSVSPCSSGSSSVRSHWSTGIRSALGASSTGISSGISTACRSGRRDRDPVGAISVDAKRDRSLGLDLVVSGSLPASSSRFASTA